MLLLHQHHQRRVAEIGNVALPLGGMLKLVECPYVTRYP